MQRGLKGHIDTGHLGQIDTLYHLTPLVRHLNMAENTLVYVFALMQLNCLV